MSNTVNNGFIDRMRHLVFGERVIEASSATGVFGRTTSPYSYKPDQIEDYYKAYLENDLIRAAIDDLAEQTVGNGYYTTVEKLSPKTKKNKAKEYIDEFGKVHNLDNMLPNVTKNALIAGFCPVETKLVVGDPEKSVLKIVHPKTVIEIKSDAGNVLSITQKVGDKKNPIKHTGYNDARTKYEGLAWFVYGQIGNDPRGNSLVKGILPTLNTLNQTTLDVQKILKRYISPMGIWKTKGKTDPIKMAVTERQPGQDIYMGNLTDKEVENTDFPKFIQIDPRVPFWEYIQYLDQRVFRYMRATDQWYYKDATVASAQEMEDIVQRHVHSVQRDIKRPVERFWFTPLTEINKLPEIPRMEFGLEQTGVEDIQPSDFIVKGVELGIITDTQYFELLRQMGVNIELVEQAEEEEEEESGEQEPQETEESRLEQEET